MVQAQELAAEGRRLGRYLLGTEPPELLVSRYVEAVQLLFPEVSRDDARAMALVRDHAWALPLLESAHGLLRPRSALRRRLVVMLAIVETSPGLASRFEPPRRHPVAVVARVAAHGVTAALKTATGVLLHLVVERRV